MKYAFCNEMFGDTPVAECFAYCAALGYTGVEIAPFTLQPNRQPFDLHEVDPGEIMALARTAVDAGLEVIGLHWLLAKTAGLHLTSIDKDIRQATIDYFHQLAEVCAAMGGSLMVLGSPQQRNVPKGMTIPEAEDAAVAVLQAVMPRCEALGVTIALEPLGPAETDFMNTAASAVALAKRVGSPNCRLHLDVKAMSTEQLSISQIIRDNRDAIAHFHANDPNLLGPGMGDVDFVPIIRALKDIGYDGWISLEVFKYEPSAEGIARMSIEHMQTIASQL